MHKDGAVAVVNTLFLTKKHINQHKKQGSSKLGLSLLSSPLCYQQLGLFPRIKVPQLAHYLRAELQPKTAPLIK